MLKFANSTTSVRFGDAIVRIAEGDPWYEDDPFVIARPELFSDTPGRVYGTRSAPIEQATARPGERRATRRG